MPQHRCIICLNTLRFSRITSSLARPRALEYISKKSLESLQVGIHHNHASLKHFFHLRFWKEFHQTWLFSTQRRSFERWTWIQFLCFHDHFEILLVSNVPICPSIYRSRSSVIIDDSKRVSLLIESLVFFSFSTAFFR